MVYMSLNVAAKKYYLKQSYGKSQTAHCLKQRWLLKCSVGLSRRLICYLKLFCFGFFSVEASGKSSLEMLRKGRQLKKILSR